MKGKLKRFIVLVGMSYYPSGWHDFQGSFDTLEAAVAKAHEGIRHMGGSYGWYEIVDSETGELVEKSS